MRCVLGGLILAMFIWKTRDQINWRKNWKIYLYTGTLNIALFYGLQTVRITARSIWTFLCDCIFPADIRGNLCVVMVRRIHDFD